MLQGSEDKPVLGSYPGMCVDAADMLCADTVGPDSTFCVFDTKADEVPREYPSFCYANILNMGRLDLQVSVRCGAVLPFQLSSCAHYPTHM